MSGRLLRAVWMCGMLWMPAGRAAPIKQATYVQTVNQADAGLEWTSPAAIPFGTALSTTQLSATAKVPGTFVYDPAAGVIPAVGTDTLSVVFTPADGNHKAASARVLIVVQPPGPSSFDLSYTSAGQPDSDDVAVAAGKPTEMAVDVQPLGDFHQPVTLTCTSSNPYLACALSAEVVRPTTSAVPVTVSVRLANASADAAGARYRLRLRGSSPAAKGSGTAAVRSVPLAVAFASLVLFGSRRTRRRTRAAFSSFLAFTLLLAGGTLLSGCGVGLHASQLTITASSLMQTKTLVFDIYQAPN